MKLSAKFTPLLALVWIATVAGAFVAGGFLTRPAMDTGGASAEPKEVAEEAERSRSGAEMPAQSTTTVAAMVPEKERETTPVDPLGRLQSAFGQTDPIQRSLQLAQALEGLHPGNLDEIVALFEEQPPTWQSQREMALLLYAWGTFDGPGAVAYAEEQGSDRRGGQFSTMMAVSAWATYDPEAALAFAEEEPAERGFNPTMMGVISGWARSDPDAAYAYVSSLDSGRERSRYTSVLTNSYLQSGLDTASRWAANLPDDDVKSDAFRSIARQWASKDPAEAAAWISSFSDAEFARSATATVAASWAREDPSAASDWVLGLPAGESRESGLTQVARQWAREDPNAAAEWLNQFPADEPGVDQAVGAFASQIVDDDPETAVAWAETIEDEALRTSSLTDVVQRWMRQDPQSAQTWVESANVSDETKTAMLEPPQRRRGRFGPFGRD